MLRLGADEERAPTIRRLRRRSPTPVPGARVTRRSIRLCGQEIDQPGHICAFFDSRDEEYETLIPYFRDGVDAGEQVLNVLDEARLRDHRDRLEAGGGPGGG